jgi:putative two-component system response regulator
MQNARANMLIVDDDPAIHRMIGRIFRRHAIDLHSAYGGPQALEHIQSKPTDLILLDLSMPGMDGFDVANQIKDDPDWQHIPIIIITGRDEADIMARALGECADDFITKTADPSEIIARVNYHLKRKRILDQLHHDQRQCHDIISLKTSQLALTLQRLKDASLEVIWRLTAASEYRDNETGQHIKRMSHYAAAMAQKMGLKKKTIDTLLYAAPMHDIGKIGIPDAILLKPGPLDEDEWVVMKSHATMGANILSGSTIGFVKMGEIIALTHHEKWDGSGYPKGLEGRSIPLIGRIIALADVFDALTSRRPYKEPFSIEKANRIIAEGKGRHFDPDIVEVFFSIPETILEIKNRFQES